jgi:hypothetical protein
MTMWPDIEKVSLFDNYPPSISKMVRLTERFDASRYFAGHTPYEWNMVQVDRDWKLKV